MSFLESGGLGGLEPSGLEQVFSSFLEPSGLVSSFLEPSGLGGLEFHKFSRGFSRQVASSRALGGLE